MEVYAAVFALLLLLSIVESYSAERAVRIGCLALGAIVTVLAIGLRWETGNDWHPYWQYYAELRGLETFSDEYDPAFRLLASTAKAVGLSYTGFLLLSASLYTALFAVVFARFRHPTMLLLLFYSIYLLGFMGTQRQTLALGLTSLAMVHLYERRWISASAQFVTAVLFHVTAVVALLAYAVPRRRIPLSVLIVGMLVGYGILHFDALGVVLDRVLSVLVGDGYLVRRLLVYQADGTWADQLANFNPLTELLWFVKRVSLVFLFWALCSTPQRSLNNYLVNLYVLSVVLFLVFIKSVPLIALRGGLYFSVFEVVLLYLALLKLSNYISKDVMVPIVAAVAAARLYAAIVLYEPDLYMPYKSIYVNSDYERFTY